MILPEEQPYQRAVSHSSACRDIVGLLYAGTDVLGSQKNAAEAQGIGHDVRKAGSVWLNALSDSVEARASGNNGGR